MTIFKCLFCLCAVKNNIEKFISEVYTMKNIGGFIKGMGTGIAVGMVAAGLTQNMTRGKKKVRKNALRAVRSVGDFVSNVQYMMK